MTSAEDVAARTAAQDAAELRQVLETMEAPVTRCTRDLRYRWVSNAYARWLRRPLEEIQGHLIADVIGAEGLAAIRPHVERVLAGERVEYEERVDFLGLGPRWIHAIYAPTRDAAGGVDGWVATVIDVDTSRRQATLLSDIFEADPGALAVLVGPDLRFAVANPAYRALLAPGLDPIGRPYASVWPDAPGRERYERLRRAMHARTPSRIDREERLCGDGRRHVFTSQACRVSWNGEAAVLSVLWETTALEEAQRELERAVARLRDLHDEREDLFRMASHDLRVPLQAVLLHAGMLAREGGAPTVARRADSIAANGRRMEAMIADMAELVRSESGDAAAQLVSVDAAALARDLLARLGESVPPGRVHVEATAPAVHADPRALERVLVNLVTNALKYSPPDAPVWIRAEPRGASVELRVEDGGPGIPPEHRAHVFDRFYRIPADRPSPGMGLGLYIARKLVERMGGEIGVESLPGRGAAFFVRLRAAPAEPRGAGAPR